MSATTVMMLKERLAEEILQPFRYTIGQGCRVESVQQLVSQAPIWVCSMV